jgi:non-homologous end joining protein Ku
MVSMITLLLIVPLNVGMMMMTIRNTSHIRRTRVTKEVISLTKRSHMVKLISGKNENLKMRAPTLIVMV